MQAKTMSILATLVLLGLCDCGQRENAANSGDLGPGQASSGGGGGSTGGGAPGGAGGGSPEEPPLGIVGHHVLWVESVTFVGMPSFWEPTLNQPMQLSILSDFSAVLAAEFGAAHGYVGTMQAGSFNLEKGAGDPVSIGRERYKSIRLELDAGGRPTGKATLAGEQVYTAPETYQSYPITATARVVRDQIGPRFNVASVRTPQGSFPWHPMTIGVSEPIDAKEFAALSLVLAPGSVQVPLAAWKEWEPRAPLGIDIATSVMGLLPATTDLAALSGGSVSLDYSGVTDLAGNPSAGSPATITFDDFGMPKKVLDVESSFFAWGSVKPPAPGSQDELLCEGRGCLVIACGTGVAGLLDVAGATEVAVVFRTRGTFQAADGYGFGAPTLKIYESGPSAAASNISTLSSVSDGGTSPWSTQTIPLTAGSRVAAFEIDGRPCRESAFILDELKVQ